MYSLLPLYFSVRGVISLIESVLVDMASGNSTYTYEGLTGWKRFRPLRPFRGMYHDIKRRLPYYRSDITDAFTYRTVASTVHMYCAKYVPFLPYPFQESGALISIASFRLLHSRLTCIAEQANSLGSMKRSFRQPWQPLYLAFLERSH